MRRLAQIVNLVLKRAFRARSNKGFVTLMAPQRSLRVCIEQVLGIFGIMDAARFSMIETIVILTP